MIRVNTEDLAAIMAHAPLTMIEYYATNESSVITAIDTPGGQEPEGITSTIELGLIGLSYTVDPNKSNHIELLPGCDEEHPVVLRLIFTKDDLRKLVSDILEQL